MPRHPALLDRCPPRLPEPRRTWYRWSFRIAAAYNLTWGGVVILAPAWSLGVVGVETDAIGRLFWQCIGMFVLVFALGYAATAAQPERYAAFVLIGTLGKICGPIGFAYGAFYLGALPRALGWAIVFNDLLWWPIWFPFVWETILRPRREAATLPTDGSAAGTEFDNQPALPLSRSANLRAGGP